MAIRRCAGGDIRHVEVVDEALAGRYRFETRDHPEERRLAAARGAEESGERALVDAQAQVADCSDRAVALGHPPEFDMRRRAAPVSCRLRAHPLIPAESMIAWVTRRWNIR